MTKAVRVMAASAAMAIAATAAAAEIGESSTAAPRRRSPLSAGFDGDDAPTGIRGGVRSRPADTGVDGAGSGSGRRLNWIHNFFHTFREDDEEEDDGNMDPKVDKIKPKKEKIPTPRPSRGPRRTKPPRPPPTPDPTREPTRSPVEASSEDATTVAPIVDDEEETTTTATATSTTTSTTATTSTTTTEEPRCHPNMDTSKCSCSGSPQYSWMENGGFIFPTVDECCSARGWTLADCAIAAADTTTTTTSTTTTTAAQCHPNMDTRKCSCTDPPQYSWMLTTPGFTFSSVDECCEANPSWDQAECKDMVQDDGGGSTTAATTTPATTTTTTTKVAGIVTDPPTEEPTKSPTPPPTTSAPTPEPTTSSPTATPLRWWPFNDVGRGIKTCEFSNTFPSDYDRLGLLYDSQHDCCEAHPEACTYPHCDGNGSGQEYWYPHENTNGDRLCAFDADYDEDWYAKAAHCRAFLFLSRGECCHEFPDACVDDGTDHGEKWYPDMDGAANGVIQCLFGDGYPEYFTLEPYLVEMHLFDDEDACCDRWNCGHELGEKWYPEVDLQLGEIVCLHSAGYPLWMTEENKVDDHLFDSEDECYAVWGDPNGDAAIATKNPTDAPTTPPTPPPTKNPTDAPTPPPTSVPTEEPTGRPTDEPTAAPTCSCRSADHPCPECWYPDIHGGETSCLHGDDYDSWMAKPGFRPTFLFDTEGECCDGRDCVAPVGEAPTTTTTTTEAPIVDDQAKEVKAYPDVMNGNKACLYDDLWPDFMGLGDNAGEYLFDSIQACCAANEDFPCNSDPPTDGPTEMPTDAPTSPPTGEPSGPPTAGPTGAPSTPPTAEPTGSPTREPKWFADIDAEGNVCIYGSDYPDFMATVPGQLFDSEALCCWAHDCDYSWEVVRGGSDR